MSSPDSDLELVRRCGRGDERALRLLVTQYEQLVFGLAKRFLGNAEDAEEVAASTFLRLWKTASTLRGECSVKSYLCQIALNLCKDRPRSKVLVAPPCPEQAVDDAFDRLIRVMQSLSAEDREVLVLYYLDEMTYDEIGNTLGITYDVLKTRLTRARQRLRNLVEVEHV